MGAATESPAPEVDTFSLTVDLGDERVVIKVDYPKGRGVAAVAALSKMGSNAGLIGLLDAMRGDPSVDAKIDELGLVFDDEDDDED